MTTLNLMFEAYLDQSDEADDTCKAVVKSREWRANHLMKPTKVRS